MNNNDFFYVKNDEIEQYQGNSGILRGIEDERSKDGVFSIERTPSSVKREGMHVTPDEELYRESSDISDERSKDGVFSIERSSSGRKSDYLYTTAEEEEMYRGRPEILEKIDLERAAARDGASTRETFSTGRKSDYLYTTAEEEEMYRGRPEILEKIDLERAAARDGASTRETFSTGRKSDYLYTTAEEEEMYRGRPEILEKIDLERAASHDGVTYMTDEEIEHERERREELRKKRLNSIINEVTSAINPEYCQIEDGAQLKNPNRNTTFNPMFVELSREILINSTLYSTGNSGKNGNNFDKMEKSLDSLNGEPYSYTELIKDMLLSMQKKLEADNFSSENYMEYVNCIIILSMITEKKYNIDRNILEKYNIDFEFTVMDIISKINHIIENDDKKQKIIPNPINFVSEVSGSEYIDIRELGMQLILAYNTKHRLSDDRSKYKKGKIEYKVPEGMLTIENIPEEIIKQSNYSRIDGRYGYYSQYSTDMTTKKTIVVDELTSTIVKVMFRQKGEDEIIIENPSMEEIESWNKKQVR